MKTYVIMLSRIFPKRHIRQGEPTEFREKLLSGEKIHTIRTNYGLWRQRIKEVQNGEAFISLRQWQDKPYRSKQVEIARLTKEDGVGIEALMLPPIGQLHYALESYPELDTHDGLDRRDWLSRYDTVSGDRIKIPDRIGFIDRKLRVISENAVEDWIEWAHEAV